ncbi:MAG TPA: hypothetical protein VMW27_30280 [Thermoanaerobaculia bacterium]|nr:hypothetical protein [Thermoanaerobaculia bacterium]
MSPRSAQLLGLLMLVVTTLFAGCTSELERATESRSRYEAALDGFTVLQQPDPTGRLDQDVEIRLRVHHRGGEELPGITVDVVQTDAARQDKRRWQVWVESGAEETTRRLEDVDYRPGDGFRVEVRQPVPEAERGEYRELAEAS